MLDAEKDAAHVVTVVYDFQGRGLHSCLRCHYAGFSAPELPCPGLVCRHCGDPIREGEKGVDWPWIHTRGFYGCIGRQGVTKAEPRVIPPAAGCSCGHGWEYHGPEVPGCCNCDCGLRGIGVLPEGSSQPG